MLHTQITNASPYRSLAVLHGRRANGQLMEFLKSYWDDSKGDGVCTMIGYSAIIETWDSFDGSWEKELERFHLKRSHMTDFVAHQGEYKGAEWKCEKYRLDYLASLLAIIRRCDLRGASASVHIESVKKCNRHFGREFSEYAVAAALCMESFCDYFGKEQQAEVFLDRIDNGRRELDAAEIILNSDPWYLEWWKKEQVSWKHLTKPQMEWNIRAKEAADLAAWECRVNAAGLLGSTDKWQGSHWSGCRESLISLGKAAPINGFVYAEDKLYELYARLV